MNRATGIIVQWNVEKGFGFAKRPFGADIYVHHTALPDDRGHLRVGEKITFGIETGGDGRRQAVDVQIVGRAAASTLGERGHA